MVISIDTECTGLDLRHSARPFFVTICFEDGKQKYWEWDVNPVTREVKADKQDIYEIHTIVTKAKFVVLQNSKFDVTAFHSIGMFDGSDRGITWDWSKTHDTLIASHILNSVMPHDLTSLALQYLGVDIQPLEDELEEACKKARRYARSKLKSWKIAKAGVEGMPSCKASATSKTDRSWKFDCWLPRAICQYEERCEEDPWWEVTQKYANGDTAVTLPLWFEMEAILRRRDLWDIYLCRLEAMRIGYDMERRGITISGNNLNELTQRYTDDAEQCERVCYSIAEHLNYELDLPRGGRNKSLETFLFDVLGLEKKKSPKGKTNAPAMDKATMLYYLNTLPPNSLGKTFIKNLLDMRSRQTAITYMDGYRKFWKPLEIPDNNWYKLHPSLNPCGTGTLRWSSSNPNEQNISRREGFNLRYCFGPAPGREWWSLDAKNIELRIPAYESGQQEFIDLFERENDPPYFGSNHLLMSHILHPKLFEECINDKGEIDGRIFKKKYASSYYQYTKNGDFALQYGAVDKEDGTGTADRAYHMPGAQKLLASRFSKQSELNQKWIKFAEKHGYVETMPDDTVNSRRGYPIICTRTEWGRILPTVPLNYHVQSTAMWWTHKAMIRTYEQLEQWRETHNFSGFLCMQVHDELVFDFPKCGDPVKDFELEKSDKQKLFRTKDSSNLWRIRIIQKLMQQGGDDIGIPTPVSVEYHPSNWSEGISL